MTLFTIQSTGRTVLRRPYFPSHRKQINFTSKKHNSNNSTPVSHSSPSPESSPNGTAIPIPATIANVPIWQRLGPLTRSFQAYGRSQRKRPYTTQFCSSLVIYFLGDLSAQSICGDDYDWKRTLRALVISMGSSIPSYKWFMFLSNNFNYSSKAVSLATKVGVNQMFFTPIFNTYFFGMQSLLSGDSLPDVVERVKRTVPTSMMNSIKLWPAVTAISFAWIPQEHRSIFAGVIAIGWQTYLSFLNRRVEGEMAGGIENTQKEVVRGPASKSSKEVAVRKESTKDAQEQKAEA
ncbi:putative mpv17 pmp22 family protein [Botrytis fragariae]|uniref:Putative mpv17 pmp22 family protein n=1 Tax=Botrytis fragariae TaxID=1964551 RepID=A0A8H6AZC7_9HELO|nr:putative mpv17 pmp22 family protein [Botrytis fragariae]KAF5876277.1 putative mpv17 pmp22 family protein [Botrytis fragariae]